MPRIELKSISKKWGDFVAVDDLNIVIEDEGFAILLGPSGCGKTTTLRMIAGLETPTQGTITIDDEVVFDSNQGVNIPPSKRNIGFLFQNYALWPHMTVKQNISFGLENLKWSKGEIENRVKEMLEMMQISELGDRYPSELSGGQQQRVAIARTLAPKPKVIFMDEPLSNLDAKLRGEMRTELKRLHSTMKSTFVYVTHDQLEAMTLGTKVCLLKKGIVQQYEHPFKIYSYPENLFVAEFIGNPTMNFIEAKVNKKTSKEISFMILGSEHIFRTDRLIDKVPENVILGVRPEHISIHDNGTFSASVYSTLPTGMETTVKLKIGEELLSAVVFGAVDYVVDQNISFDITSNSIVLFDKETTYAICSGEID